MATFLWCDVLAGRRKLVELSAALVQSQSAVAELKLELRKKQLSVESDTLNKMMSQMHQAREDCEAQLVEKDAAIVEANAALEVRHESHPAFHSYLLGV